MLVIDPKVYSLIKVAETGSYTRAAEQLSLTQPAVSQHIRALEGELGIRILSASITNCASPMRAKRPSSMPSACCRCITTCSAT